VIWGVISLFLLMRGGVEEAPPSLLPAKCWHCQSENSQDFSVLLHKLYHNHQPPQPMPDEAAATSSDSNLVIDPSIVVVNPANYDTSTTRHRTKITLHDLKKVLQKDLNTSEVTIEQIQRVKLMHDKFHEGAVFNFNYNTLLIVASVIAGLGLVSDSTATVIASMLGELKH
jgi:hypothetical protein